MSCWREGSACSTARCARDRSRRCSECMWVVYRAVSVLLSAVCLMSL